MFLLTHRPSSVAAEKQNKAARSAVQDQTPKREINTRTKGGSCGDIIRLEKWGQCRTDRGGSTRCVADRPAMADLEHGKVAPLEVYWSFLRLAVAYKSDFCWWWHSGVWYSQAAVCPHTALAHFFAMPCLLIWITSRLFLAWWRGSVLVSACSR